MNHEYNLLFSFKVEKQWQKRVQQWQLEREARRKMTEEMVVIRKQQIAEKCKLKLRQTIVLNMNTERNSTFSLVRVGNLYR